MRTTTIALGRLAQFGQCLHSLTGGSVPNPPATYANSSPALITRLLTISGFADDLHVEILSIARRSFALIGLGIGEDPVIRS